MKGERADMTELTVLMPRNKSENSRLQSVIGYILSGRKYDIIEYFTDIPIKLQGRRLLFAIDLGSDGINIEYYKMLSIIRNNHGLLEGCIGGVIVDGKDELYTKSTARELVFAANQSGCTFPGSPLVEATGSLYNFHIAAKNLEVDLYDAYRILSAKLLDRILEYKPPVIKHEKPELLVIHASSHTSSNTLKLWDMVRKELDGISIKEISLRNGTISDCEGCPYNMCMHFSKKGSCFYGGVIVEEVYPAVEECDALLMLCPNYNDALSANLSAFINRLTSLYRKRQFYEKYLYGIIVSGYSGGNILAEQLISGLNMNKTFLLPPNFAILETANDPGSICNNIDIEKRAEDYGEMIKKQLLQYTN